MSARPPRDTAWRPYAREAFSRDDLATHVHVWRARLDRSAEQRVENLPADERGRALRFHHEGDRRRFIAARSILRNVLADALGEGDGSAGQRLRFGYGASGKPFLLDAPWLHFNLSHSEDLALIAVTRTGEVGIDVERRRWVRDMDGIARVAFDDQERAALAGCPAEARELVFFRIWTRKEAMLKAAGSGLGAIHDAPAPRAVPENSAICLSMLPHLDGYVACLCRPRAAHGLKLWSWPNAVSMRAAERRAHPRPMPMVTRSFLYSPEVRS